ncbi:3137_t:CDS:1, partial [Acaulospora colombiana]
GYGLFKLLSVSRAWQFFLKSSSVLWNRIAYGEGRMSVNQIRLSLVLSKNVPLYLEILLQDHFSDSPLIMADLLKNDTHRIREILMQHHSRYDGEPLIRDLLFRDTLSVLRGLGTFSTCECLTYIGSPMDGLIQVDGRELPDMPAIRHLIGFSLDSSTLDINLNTVMHFSSASSAYSLEPILQRCTRLQQLDLLDTLEQNINFREPSKLPSLEVLVFDRSGVSNIRPLLMLKGDRLKTLHLKLQWFELADMTFLSHLPILTHLSIDFVLPKYTIRELSINIPPLPKVEEFHFNERSEAPDQKYDGTPPSLENLFTALIQNVLQPRTLSFDLFRPVPPRLMLRYLRSLKNLEDLQYHHENPYTEVLNEPPTRL